MMAEPPQTIKEDFMSKIFTPEEITVSLRVCAEGSRHSCDRCAASGQGIRACLDIFAAAADLIEARAKRIAELEGLVEDRTKDVLFYAEREKWIPVEERLPDKDGVYEVWKNVKHPHLGQQFDKAQFYNGSWHGNGGRWANVTHWKPIPKGPEVE